MVQFSVEFAWIRRDCKRNPRSFRSNREALETPEKLQKQLRSFRNTQEALEAIKKLQKHLTSFRGNREALESHEKLLAKKSFRTSQKALESPKSVLFLSRLSPSLFMWFIYHSYRDVVDFRFKILVYCILEYVLNLNTTFSQILIQIFFYFVNFLRLLLKKHFLPIAEEGKVAPVAREV